MLSSSTFQKSTFSSGLHETDEPSLPSWLTYVSLVETKLSSIRSIISRLDREVIAAASSTSCILEYGISVIENKDRLQTIEYSMEKYVIIEE